MNHVDAYGIDRNATQPIPRRTRPRLRAIGEVRLPIAGPYRPRARLFRLPDGRPVWVVRLWEYDRPVAHVVSTATLRAFARTNRLSDLELEIDRVAARLRPEVRCGPE